MRLSQLSEDPTNIDFDQYKDIKPHGISLASLLETYNSCMGSSLEVEDEKLNQLIKEADEFLANHSFVNYDSK